jgi:sulfur carrier protein
MKLIINGEERDFNEEIKIIEILEQLKIKDKVMAVAVNMEVVKKENWDKFQPSENDKIELLQFVGGG